MDAAIGKVFDSVSDFFSGAASASADEFPLCDSDIISGCEKELAEAQKAQDEGRKKECIMRLSWALVHSKMPGDIQRGIAMLEALVVNDTSAMKLREKLYLLALGYYRSGDFSRSRDCIERCLEVEPEWGQAQTLKKAIEDRIVKDGVIGVGIAVTAVGLVAGIAAAIIRS
ncbi:Fis1 C-terminal tetratricopeptide repeat [Arabidopsis thaliana x Arabidopsis arenosa]|uniref:Mitochondrial fission 1 protein n=1 Tax=Arabidopsis thaliana x Arabidopsis arenosa TaxID=1240361 RepID=A0A8T1YVA4_9BRAS|nr:Fis1 C-terminal tetratricopeptide repeat [Arabidopsis thaliana x Arabidopsis arenosa]